MEGLTLTRDTYRDKVYGAWLGCAAGSTLGVPLEGRREFLRAQYYDPVPGQAAANDELDIQLLWLQTLTSVGPSLTSSHLAEAFVRNITYTCDEYGYAARNLRRGLNPPLSGAFDNWFAHGVLGASRSSIWGLVCPAAPQTAAAYAHSDAVVTNAEEGVWAAMMWAAMVSAAFMVSSASQLLDIGLAMVPANSRVARAVRTARDSYFAQLDIMDSRAAVIREVGNANFSDVAQNLGFSVLGLLYGKGDFGASLCAAVGCGYATGANAAMLGSLLGAMYGKAGLPARWIDPVSDIVPVGAGAPNLVPPQSMEQLADITVEAGLKVIAYKLLDVEITDIAPTSASSAEPITSTSVSRTDLIELDDQPAPTEGAGNEPSAVVDPTGAEAVSADSPSSGGAEESDEAAPDETPVVGVEPPLPASPRYEWQANDTVKALLVASASVSRYTVGAFEVVVDYGKAPTIGPGITTMITVQIHNTAESRFDGAVTLEAPVGWKCVAPGAQGSRQAIAAGGSVTLGWVVHCAASAVFAATNHLMLRIAATGQPEASLTIPLIGQNAWWIVGPLRNEGEEGFGRVYEVEDKPGLAESYLGREKALARWSRYLEPGASINLESLFNRRSGVAYCQCTLVAPQLLPIRLVVHTNDGVQLWINQQKLVMNHAHDDYRPTLGYGGVAVDTVLSAGVNTLMVKAVRCGEPYHLSIAVCDRSGRPLDDIVFRADN